MDIDYSRLPEHMRESAQGYVEEGIPVGSFLTAVLSNDLIGAYRAADSTNVAAMHEWARWLYELPCVAWGSAAKVTLWQVRGGLKGFAAPPDCALDCVV